MHSRGELEILHRAQHGQGQKMAVIVWLRSGHWVQLGEASHWTELIEQGVARAGGRQQLAREDLMIH